MPVPVGYAECAIPARYDAGGSYGYVVFGVENNTIFTNPATIADEIWGVFSTTLLALLDDTIQWGPVEVSVGTSSGDLSGVGVGTASGGATINSPPPNAAVLVTKSTNTGGRRGRGRMYWPWAADESTVGEGGVWAGSAVANFQAACDDFLADLTTADLPMVILHRDGGVPSPVTQLTVQALLATQRRRLRR